MSDAFTRLSVKMPDRVNPNWVLPTRDYRFSGYQLQRQKCRHTESNNIILPPINQKESYSVERIRQANFNYKTDTVYIAQNDGTLRRQSGFIKYNDESPILPCDPDTERNIPGQATENRRLCRTDRSISNCNQSSTLRRTP